MWGPTPNRQAWQEMRRLDARGARDQRAGDTHPELTTPETQEGGGWGSR